VKTIKPRILGLINTIITGAVTGFVLATYISGMEENSRCEYCSMMIYPSMVFMILLFPGVYTLFCPIKSFNKRKSLLNTLNIIGILLSLGAIIFNIMSSPSANN